MFQLREAHIQAFRSGAMDNFEQRAIRHLRRRLRKQTSLFSDEQLRQRVRDGIPRARTYGLTTERQIMCFVDSGFLIGEDFDSRPDTSFWTRPLLTMKELDADRRAHWLLHGAEKVARGEGPKQPGASHG